jgi:hypothetical protein
VRERQLDQLVMDREHGAAEGFGDPLAAVPLTSEADE